ncbi:MAG: leucyl/phenylalanyl-tRNA--protein transferase [Pseudomonadota bacterium]
MSLYWLGNDSGIDFPPVESALKEPDGLLAAGGDLGEARLLAAYQRGIFPWYSHGQPILWWSPDPRMVLFPEDFHASRSLRRAERRYAPVVTVNRCFQQVVDQCAAPRDDDHGTWITPEMSAAYVSLHRRGWAHSIEVWVGDALIGGVYGVAIGKAFFGESMFSSQANGSKFALKALCQQLVIDGFQVLDCQMHTSHLQTLGARLITRAAFTSILDTACKPLKTWIPPTHIIGEKR